ncbi:MAG: ArnT family glycosyltransferase, partial [bacterium]
MSGLFALALLPRLYQLGSAPPGLNGDEIYNIIDARRIGWGNWPIFLPGNNGREALYFYPMALSLRLLGDSVLAVRLPSVLFGAGSAALTYLTGKELFNHRVGLAAGLFVAVALWPVMPSRIGLRAISLTFFTALTVLLLARGVRRGQRTWLLAGGVALGLTMYTYIPGRVFPAVIVGWAASLWIWRRPQWRANRRSLLLAFLLALVIFAPFGLYMLQQPHQVNQRIYSMENALQRAQRGEPEALLGSIG